MTSLLTAVILMTYYFFAVGSVVAAFPKIPVLVEYFSGL